MDVCRALTIAGSDSGGGAGIQADLKTFTMLDVYGMSVITAITAQNTLGVFGIYDVPLEAIERQLDAVVTDIGVDAVKTGMLSQISVIELVAAKIKQYRLRSFVLDPVMVSKGGTELLNRDAKQTLRSTLIPLAAVVTPNLPEAEELVGMSISSIDGMKLAARRIVDEMGAGAAIIKGGHLAGEPTDVLYDGKDFAMYTSVRFHTRHTHGTGCTFSAAIAAQLAKGCTMHNAVQTAKEYITMAIQDELGIGQGHGPTNHWAYGRRLKRMIDLNL